QLANEVALEVRGRDVQPRFGACRAAHHVPGSSAYRYVLHTITVNVPNPGHGEPEIIGARESRQGGAAPGFKDDDARTSKNCQLGCGAQRGSQTALGVATGVEEE